MKRQLFALLLGLLLCAHLLAHCPAVNAEAEASNSVVAAGETLRAAKQANLRKKADRASVLVERLDAGSRVQVLDLVQDDKDTWAHVRVTRNGHEGYVLAELLEPIPTPSPTPTATPVPTPSPTPSPTPVPTATPEPWPESQSDAYRTTKQANLRRKPERDAVMLEVLAKGSPVRILSTTKNGDDTWAYVHAKRTNREGYLLMELLEPELQRGSASSASPAASSAPVSGGGAVTIGGRDAVPAENIYADGETRYTEDYVFRTLKQINIRDLPDGALVDRMAEGARLTAIGEVTTSLGVRWIHVRAGTRNLAGYVQAELLKQIRPVALTQVSETAVREKYPVVSLHPIEDIVREIPFQYTEEELSKYHTISVGDREDAVERIRERLYTLGYYRKRNVGKQYTQSTADVVAMFQRDCGVNPDGVATPLTQALLFDERIVAIAKDNSPSQLQYLDNRQQPLYIQRVYVGSWDYYGAIQVCLRNQTTSRLTGFGLVILPYLSDGTLAGAAENFAEEAAKVYTLSKISVPAGYGYSDFEIEEESDWEFTFPHYFTVAKNVYFKSAQVAVKWYRVGGKTITVDDDQLVFFPAGKLTSEQLIKTLPIEVSAQESAEAAAWETGIEARYVLPPWQEHYGLPQGAYITSVAPGSPMEDAGLKSGDVLVGIGDTAILGSATLRQAAGSIRAGSSVLTVFWRDGAYYATELIRPAQDAALR